MTNTEGIVVNRKGFLEALRAVGKVIPWKHKALPIITCVKIEAGSAQLHLTGTDLDLYIQTSLPYQGITEEDAWCLPYRTLLAILQASDAEEVTLLLGRDKSIIRQEGDSTITCYPAGEYPSAVPLVDSKNGVLCNANPASGFWNAVARAEVSCAPKDEIRTVLCGMLFHFEGNQIEMAATNGRTLAVSTYTNPVVESKAREFIIPHSCLKVARLLLRLKVFSLSMDEYFVKFEGQGIRITARLSDGQFPDYKGLMDKEKPYSLEVNKTLFVNTIRRAMVMAQDFQNPGTVQFYMRKESCTAKAYTTAPEDVYREELPCLWNGPETYMIGFNGRYFLDYLLHSKQEKVKLQLSDNHSAGFFIEEGFKFLVMPIRIREEIYV